MFKKLLLTAGLLAVLFSPPAFAYENLANFAGGELVGVSATTTAQWQAFALSGSANNQDAYIVNTGSVGVFVSFTGVATNTASSGSYGNEYYIAPNTAKVVFKGKATQVSIITASSTATVFVQAGSGS